MQTRSPSCPPIWDIIHHYANISVDDLENSLDSPENGILLQIEMHRTFERFDWCLIATVSQGFRAFIRLKLTVAFCRGNKTNTTWSGFATPSSSSPPLDVKVVTFQKSTQPAYYSASQTRVFSSACSDCAYFAWNKVRRVLQHHNRLLHA